MSTSGALCSHSRSSVAGMPAGERWPNSYRLRGTRCAAHASPTPHIRHVLRACRIAADDLAVWQTGQIDHRTRGLAVTLGRSAGTAQVRRFTFTGFLAWWMGRSYHLLMMPGLGRKSRV